MTIKDKPLRARFNVHKYERTWVGRRVEWDDFGATHSGIITDCLMGIQDGNRTVLAWVACDDGFMRREWAHRMHVIAERPIDPRVEE